MMFRKLMTLVVIGALVHLSCARIAAANNRNEKEAQLAEKLRAGIAKLGTGRDARVKVELRDGTKLDGYIAEANAVSFVVVDSKTGAATTVPYPQVKRVKGNNLSSGAKFAIFIGAVVAGLVILAIVIGKG